MPVVQVDMDNNSLWCNKVSLNSLVSIGLICHKPNSTKTENYQIQNFIKKSSNKDYILAGDFNYGNVNDVTRKYCR